MPITKQQCEIYSCDCDGCPRRQWTDSGQPRDWVVVRGDPGGFATQTYCSLRCAADSLAGYLSLDRVKELSAGYEFRTAHNLSDSKMRQLYAAEQNYLRVHDKASDENSPETAQKETEA